MGKTNKTKYVILGLLMDRSLTGYEIREIIKQSTSYFWDESDASIYPTLKLLAKEGKVHSQIAFVGKRKKEIFTISQTGKEEFAEWFPKPPEPDTRREEFLLKLFFTTEETEEEMNTHFNRRFRNLLDILEEYKQIEQKLLTEFPKKPFWMMTLRNGIAHLELEIAWVKQHLQGALK